MRLPRVEQLYDASWRAWETASAMVALRPLDEKAQLAVQIAMATV